LQNRLIETMEQQGRITAIQPTEREMRAFFDARIGQVEGERPATIAFQQIVIQPEPSEAAKDAALALADSVLLLLRDGADFAELAKERSTGPSGPKGGDLGYFTADQMVPEFSEAAAALEPGSYTKEPAKTQFGWHVIKLEDRRTAAPPPFEELEQQLREQVARETLEVVLNDLRDGAEIEIVSQNDAPTGAAAPAPAPVPAPVQ